MPTTLKLWTHPDDHFDRRDIFLRPDVVSPPLKRGDIIRLAQPGTVVLDEPLRQEDVRTFPRRIFVVYDEPSAAMLAKSPAVKISVSSQMASVFGFNACHGDMDISRVSPSDAPYAEFVLVSFRDQYIGRYDMWRLKQHLVGREVYVRKKVIFAGCIQATVREVYVRGKPETSGVVTEKTRIIFRSDSAKFFIFIQMSREMWEFDDTGQLRIDLATSHFLPELFQRWASLNTNHICTIVLFARVYYNNPSQDRRLCDWNGRYYKDFYRVLVDWESASQLQVMQTWIGHIKAAHRAFQQEILERHMDGYVSIAGVNSGASEGNVLQAINLALNAYDRHYVDRDLLRTGLGIVVITPSAGFFDVDKKLLRLTTERMYDSGIALDLVCLSKIPLHRAPLFRYKSMIRAPDSTGTLPSRSLQGPGSSSAKSFAPVDPLYEDDLTGETASEYFFHIPHWIVTTFYHIDVIKDPSLALVPSCRMPSGFPWNITTLDLNRSMPPFLPDNLENHDEHVFTSMISSGNKRFSTALGTDAHLFSPFPTDQGIDATPSKEITLTGTRPVDIKGTRRGTQDIIVSDKYSPRSALSTSPSYSLKGSSIGRASTVFSRRLNLVNPFGEAFGATTNSGHLRRWEHLYPVTRKQFQSVKWTSLCTPACLPLTTDIFPSPSDLDNNYLEYVYTVTPYEDIQSDQDSEVLLREMIGQRLAQGFQLVDQSGNRSKRALNPRHLSAGPVYLTMGYHIHRLSYDPILRNLEVRRYMRRLKHDMSLVEYQCAIWPKFRDRFEMRPVTFRYPYQTVYNWNYLDRFVAGHEEKMSDSLKFWRTRFILIPVENMNTLRSTLGREAESMDEEECRLAGFSRFMEVFERARWRPTPPGGRSGVSTATKRSHIPAITSLGIIFTTKSCSEFVRSEGRRTADVSMLDEDPMQRSITSLEQAQLTRTAPVKAIVEAMIQPGTGIRFENRWWRVEYENTFVGSEFVDWILRAFSDIETRTEATEFASELLEQGIIEHCNGRHGFLDGFFFYRVKQEQLMAIQNQQTSTMRKFFFFRTSRSNTNESVHTSPSIASSAPSDASTVVLSRKFYIDLDPQRKSDRKEMAVLHYDLLHNSNACYHFHLNWIGCTARLIEDVLQGWGRQAERYGMRLVEVPVDQPLELSPNVFQMPMEIRLAQPPPTEEDIYRLGINATREEFMERLAQYFGFIIDVEADSHFPPDVRLVYSYSRMPYPYTQYVHATGVALLQLREPERGFVWTDNRFLTSQSSSLFRTTIASVSSGPHHPRDERWRIPDVASMRRNIQSFCSDRVALNSFWEKCIEAMRHEKQISTVDVIPLNDSIDAE